jgi:hypothetical protein
VIDDDQTAAEPIEEGTADSGITDQGIDENGINVRVLSEIAGRLPCDSADEFDALQIFAQIQAALLAFIEAYQESRAGHATIGPVREDLKRLGVALAEFNAAWVAMSARTKREIIEASGQPPFDDLEQRPVAAMPDAWERGNYRIVNFKRAADQIAGAITSARAAADAADQDRRSTVPGLGALSDRLAAIFTEHTRRSPSLSRNRDGALGWIQQAVETLPDHFRPSADKVAWAVRRSIKRALCE